jgi:hypothetical protein
MTASEMPGKPQLPQPRYEIGEDFFEAYANNIYYEASSWDLRLIFGQIDQRDQLTHGLKIVQHSAITIPWPMAKLLHFWLKGQIEAHELTNGKIHVPPNVIPPKLPEPSKELISLDSNAAAVYAIFNRIRDEFIASLKS